MSYTSVSEVKAYLGISGTTDDALIASLIDAAHKTIDSYTGRRFEALADGTHYFTVGEDTDCSTLYLDDDLCQITSIITNADASSTTTLATTDYVTQPRNTTPYYAIRLLASKGQEWTYEDDPETGITVTGRWAWSIVPPDDIKQACTRLAGYYYRQKDAGVYDTTAIPDAGIIQVPQGIPRDVQLILAPYVRNN